VQSARKMRCLHARMRLCNLENVLRFLNIRRVRLLGCRFVINEKKGEIMRKKALGIFMILALPPCGQPRHAFKSGSGCIGFLRSLQRWSGDRLS